MKPRLAAAEDRSSPSRPVFAAATPLFQTIVIGYPNEFPFDQKRFAGMAAAWSCRRAARRAIYPRVMIMPKQKTHKGTKKRFRLTATGKVKHRRAGTSHLAFRKTHKQKRNLRGTAVLAEPFTKAIATVLAGNSY